MVLVERPWLTFLVLAIVASAAGYGLNSLTVNNAMEAFLPENSPTIRENEAFAQVFAEQDIVFVLVESEDVFSYSTLTYIEQVTEDLEREVPFVAEVISLTNLSHMEMIDETLTIRELFPDGLPDDSASLAAARESVMSRPMVAEMLVSEDQQATGIFVILENIPSTVYAQVPPGFSPTDQIGWAAEDILDQDRIFFEAAEGLTAINNPPNLLAPAVERVLARHAQDGIHAIGTGMHIIDFHGDALMFDQARMLLIVTFLVSTVLMALLTRGLRTVVASAVAILLSVTVLMGIFGWAGEPLNMVSAAVPVVLMMVIGVSYSIHVVNHFKTGLEQGLTRKHAVRYAYAEAAWPVFVSALTSALGFVSFLLVPLPPIRVVGIACALGSFITYFMVMVVMPVSLSLGADKVLLPKAYKKTTRGLPALMMRLSDIISCRLQTILLATVLVMLVMGVFATSIRTNPDMLEMAGDRLDFIRDANYAIERLGALYTYEVYIELPEPSLARQSQVLAGLNRLQQEIKALDSTVNTASLVDLLKEMNMILNDGTLEHLEVPDSDQLIAQYLLLYELAGGDGLENYVDFDYQKLRINVQIREFSGELFQALQEVEELGVELFPEGTQVSVVGEVPLLLEALDLLAHGNVRSLFTAILVITLVMIVVLKSVRLGLLSMIPNALPIITALGFMSLMDIPLDFFTIMVTPMILGIAVDDTVHYFIHFKAEFDSVGSYVDANRQNFGKIGRALVFTTVILVAGFAVLTLLPITGFQHMAMVAAVGISVALLGDILVAPALIMAFRPFGGKPEKKTQRMEEL